MAVMLVRALGYTTLSGSLKNVRTPFTDVKSNLTCIAMAYDFGIIRGSTPTTFNPKGSASREEAATMMVRLYKNYYSKINWTHAFYALSSYGQKDMIPVFDALSFGWSRLEADTNGVTVLNTTSSGGNAFRIPTDYQEVVELTKNSGVSNHLNVFMSTSQKVTLPDGTVTDACAAILNKPENRALAITQIVAELQVKANGVTIDLEEMRGSCQDSFSLFLPELRRNIETRLTLYVCVPPVTSDGVYYDGYDYKTIG